MSIVADGVTVRAAAERIADVFSDLFASLERWREAAGDLLVSPENRTSSAVDRLVEAFAVPAVTEQGLVTGAGFVAAPGLLDDAQWHLSWWLAAPGTTARRLLAVSDPDADAFRDYTTLEWWRIPATTRSRHLTGPYVDYVCTEDSTVTITVPVILGEEMVGIVGADVLVDRLDRVLLPTLRQLPGPVALVNYTGRVITATETHREPGSMLRADGLRDALAPLRSAAPGPVDAALPSGAHVVSCGDTSLALVVGLDRLRTD
ncbi:cache domain-containing protein [Microbacterium mangrovi]|uniref:cache domain-containing protein n=1 Tax=Microbacterium mangrovi TaxID=1348253 RepID=UPI00068F6AB1|nr:cache domain-containing protein [Microbacterium mangrovi]